VLEQAEPALPKRDGMWDREPCEWRFNSREPQKISLRCFYLRRPKLSADSHIIEAAPLVLFFNAGFHALLHSMH